MNKNKLIILTGNDDFFGQTRKPWVSMNIKKVMQYLQDHGLEVTKYSFHEIVNMDDPPRDSIIFYTFSQKLNRRRYIRDIVYHLSQLNNLMLPSLDLLLCHEDKGFQELFKKRVGVESVPAYFFSSIKELDVYTIEYPVVLKTPDGSNGKGVFLAEDEQDLRSLISGLQPVDALTRLDLLRRKYFRRTKTYKDYPDYDNRSDYWMYRDYITPESNFIVQKFVPDLNYDYRILIIYDKYYVVRRYTKPDDFRASGAKRFQFDFTPDPQLMAYAESIYNKMPFSPYLSIDIGQYNDQYLLFEYQAIHFGINPFIKNGGYYKKESGEWKYYPRENEFEIEMAYGLLHYINERL